MSSEPSHREESNGLTRSGAHAMGMIVLAWIGAILVVNIADAIAFGYGITEETNETVWRSIVMAGQFLGFLVAVVVYLQWIEDAKGLIKWRAPSLSDLGWTVLGFIGVIIAANVAAAAASSAGAETATNRVIELGREDPTLFLYMIPITVLLVAPAEELVFRGVIQGRFRRSLGAGWAILLASAVFGAVHFVALEGEGKLTYVVVAAVLGLLLGAVYERTNNILVPIAIHATWNTLLFYSQWYMVTHPEAVPGLI